MLDVGDISVTREGPVAVLTLNRPAASNAFTATMIGELAEALGAAADDGECRAIVVTGAGKAFCAGGDLGELGAELTPLDYKDVLWRGVHRIPLLLQSIDKPVIAAINGAAVGAGLDMALMCDLRLIAESAKISTGYARVGLVPGDGGAWFLPRIVGLAKALELLWTSDFLSGREAVKVGLASYCYPDDDLLPRTVELAHRIAERPPLVVQIMKRAAVQGLRTDLVTHLDQISSHMAVIRSTSDSQEAMRAFREKRPGHYNAR